MSQFIQKNDHLEREKRRNEKRFVKFRLKEVLRTIKKILEY